jgi:small GTP-binding protein
VGIATQVIPIRETLYHVSFFDTSGQERYRSVAPAMVHGADVGVLIFDVTAHADTFDAISGWIDFLKGIEDCPCVVVGNKIDLTNQRAVSTVDGYTFASSRGFQYYETSAKSGEGVKLAFESIWADAVDRIGVSQRPILTTQTEMTVQAQDPRSKSHERVFFSLLSQGPKKNHMDSLTMHYLAF